MFTILMFIAAFGFGWLFRALLYNIQTRGLLDDIEETITVAAQKPSAYDVVELARAGLL